MGKTTIVIGSLLLLLTVAGAGGYFYFSNSVSYEGFRSVKVTSVDDSLLHADVTIALRNGAFTPLDLEQLETRILGSGKPIGSVTVDSVVELAPGTVQDLVLKLTLRMKESMRFFKNAGDTLDLSVAGKAVAGISFISFPVNLDFAIPIDLNKQLLDGGSGAGDGIFTFKGVENIRLEGDSLKFDLITELNNPFDMELTVISIDSGKVFTRGNVAGTIYLSAPVTIEKKAKGTQATVNASCYVGDMLKAGPGALLGVLVSGGQLEYEVNGYVVFEVAGERATLPVKYKDSLSIGELIKQ